MRLVELGMLLLIMVIWGFNFPLVKLGVGEIPPILLMAIRFGIVALVMVPFVAVPRAQLRGLMVVSFVLGSLHFPTMFTGLKYLDSATVAIVSQVQVPFSALLAWFFFGDVMSPARWLGLGVAIAGVVLIAGEPKLAGSFADGIGPILLVVAGAFTWAFTIVLVKRIGQFDGLQLNAWTAAFVAPQLFLSSALLETGQVAALQAATWRTALAIGFTAVFVSIVSHTLWYRLVQRHPVNTVMPFTLLAPVFGVLAGIVMLGETLTWQGAVGSALTLAGVAAIVLRKAPAPSAPPPASPGKAA
ncbi:MAG: EamA family transporter [Alphaproteobacteria bacterium]|nr:EamA family transporter [Alphaproteobacteria bacterium]